MPVPRPISPQAAARIRRRLLGWYRRAARNLPWRGTRDPYRIWVAEIMLQQTRAAAVAPYYARFLARFPNVAALAAAGERQVLACWSGLGYYGRARRLRQAARLILRRGGFPKDSAGWRALPGVGDYTAAAIASIAFRRPRPALDGNGLRVLSRLAAEHGASSAARRRLEALAEGLLDREDPGGFNQALMDLGATLCTPRRPQCPRCPLAQDCEARRLGLEGELPRRQRRPATLARTRTLLLIERDGALLLRKLGRGRLKGFWELPEAGSMPEARLRRRLGEFRHGITRYDYRIEVWEAALEGAPPGARWFPRDRLAEWPVSTATRKALALAEDRAAASLRRPAVS